MKKYFSTDPRLGGGVVVANHAGGVNVGDVVDISDTERVFVTFGGGDNS